MRFNPNLLDDIRARLPVSLVVGRKVALKKAGREYKGLSPFKTERTPSFTVNDQKGFYHCFATGEHGDIFKFVMMTEGLSFPEAVERLAAEAGVAMPKTTAQSAEQDDQRARLLKLVEASANFFEAQLQGSTGRDARAYIEKRGLVRQTATTFRLGHAPASRSALKDHLRQLGFSIGDMIASGMLIGGEDIAEPYDRFRNRLMFPIEDLKGRVIAFGGRALDKDAPAKYLNSPETPLFHKGHVLFNAHRARPLAHDRNRVIAVEGYMDVVALAEAGFGEAVAPLGTALTEDQVKLLWRFVPEPVLCFDGDSAGQKAAHRAVDTVLPHLKPGISVAFAFLPDGQDPDDVVRQQGPAAFAAVLDKTRPLIDVLWNREVNAGPLATPEQKAALEGRLRGLAASIGDQIVREHYAREFRERLFALSRLQAGAVRNPAGQRLGRSQGTSYARPVAPSDWRQRDRNRLYGPPKGRYGAFRAGVPGPAAAGAELTSLSPPLPAREALILRLLMTHPWLIDQECEIVADLPLTSPALAALRDEILAIHATSNSLDSATLHTQLGSTGVARVADLVTRSQTHKSDRFAEAGAEAADVLAGWQDILALHRRQVGLEQMLKAAEDAWFQDCTKEAEDRLFEVKRQIAQSSAEERPVETPGALEPYGQQVSPGALRQTG